MARNHIAKGDTVVVTALGSKYRGKVGEVRSFTDSKESARLVLQDGSKHTLRVSSLKLAVSQAVSPKRSTKHCDSEVQQLREELKAARKLVRKLVKLLDAEPIDTTSHRHSQYDSMPFH